MQPRIRKLIGTPILVIFIIVYSLLVMKLSAATLPTMGGWSHFGFFLLFGLGWIIPAGAIVWWMQKP